MNDIQHLINKKADDKLERDIDALAAILQSRPYYKLLSGIEVNIGDAENPKMVNLVYIFSRSGLRSKVITHNTERYREEETDEFLKTIESIKDDIANLYGSIGH